MKNALFKKVDLIQGSNDWKSWRRFKIGASEVAAIMGDCPYTTPLQLYDKKIERIESAQNTAMLIGHENEEKARNRANLVLSRKYEPACFQSLIHPHLIASLDGYDETAEFSILEIKYLNKDLFQSLGNEEICMHHQWQLQAQMLVMNRSSALYLGCNQDQYLIQEYYSNPKMVKEIINESERFYEGLMNFDPPSACDQDIIKIEDKSLIGLSEEYEQLDHVNKMSEIQMLAIKKKISAYLEEKNIKRASIGNKKMSYVLSKGRVDYKGLAEKLIDKEELKQEIESFRSENKGSWRFV